MALDVTTDPQPAFAASTSVSTTCTEIQAKPFSQVALFGSGAMYVFNGVADGGTVAGATLRKALDATQAASGLVVSIGGPVQGQSYGTVCVASQSGTITVEVMSVPPSRVAP